MFCIRKLWELLSCYRGDSIPDHTEPRNTTSTNRLAEVHSYDGKSHVQNRQCIVRAEKPDDARLSQLEPAAYADAHVHFALRTSI